MRSYETARSLYSFLGFCAWAVIVLGVIIAFMGGSATQALGRNAGAMQFIMGALPGLLMALAGTYGQAMVQMGRTSVDTAEYAQQSLDVSRQQLEVAKQALAQGKAMAAAYPVTQGSKPASVPIEEPAAAAASYSAEPTPATDEEADAVLPAPELAAVETPDPDKQIIHQDGFYHFGGQTFRTEAAALQYASQLGVNPNAKLSPPVNDA